MVIPMCLLVLFYLEVRASGLNSELRQGCLGFDPFLSVFLKEILEESHRA